MLTFLSYVYHCTNLESICIFFFTFFVFVDIVYPFILVATFVQTGNIMERYDAYPLY